MNYQKQLCCIIFIFLIPNFIATRSNDPSASPEIVRKLRSLALPNVIEISSGLVQGSQITSRGVTSVVFRGIPTAEAPTGPLRFRKPRPRHRWNGILNATQFTDACPWNSSDTSTLPQDFPMNEDCLQANVFTNEFCIRNKSCAVLFYVHGGNYAYGSAAQFPVEFIIENFANESRNIVFVLPQFRLSVFGMLNLNHNLKLDFDMRTGYEDIIHALEWTRDEISAFGGDPSRITILGHSGGGQAVRILLADPRVNVFVQQFVVMSGANVVEYPDTNEAESRLIAKFVGCTGIEANDERWNNNTIVNTVLSCLREKPVKALTDAQRQAEDLGFMIKGQPSYGGNYQDLLTRALASKKQMKLLTGTVSREELLSRDTVVQGVYVNQKALASWCAKLLVNEQYCELNENLTEACMNEYNRASRSIFLYDDMNFFVPTERLAATFATYGKAVYLYEFTYQGTGAAFVQGPGKAPYVMDEEPFHSQDLMYLTGLHAGNLTKKDRQIQFLYSQFFADFINTGSPNSSWERFDKIDKNYFEINFPDPDLESPGNTEDYHDSAVKFFDTTLRSIADPCNDTNASQMRELLKTAEAEAVAEEGRWFWQNINWWNVLFWAGAGIIVILVVSLLFTCSKLHTKKSEYQYI